MLDRRLFLGAGIAGASALTFSSVWSQSAPNFGLPDLPSVGYKRMKLGKMEVIALNDGAVRRPLGEEFVTNAPLEQVKALLASQNLPTDYIDVPYTPFLLINGDQRYLFDTGFADNGPPTTGKLAAQLAAVGLKPTDINNVVLSHYHGDHINGLRNKAGELVYPNARVHVPATEHAFWMDDARMEAAPPAMKGAFMGVRRVTWVAISWSSLNRVLWWPLALHRWRPLVTPLATHCSAWILKASRLLMWPTLPMCLPCLHVRPIGLCCLT
jgi:hypothetical protein